MNKILTILLILAACSNAMAQHTLTGRIVGIDNAPLPYAVVKTGNIATNEIKATITDSTGNFKFENMNVGKYALMADYVGYKRGGTMFDMPDNDFCIPDLVLQESDNQLDAIEVKGRRIEDVGDHKQIFPSEMLKNNANNGYTALAMLLIPRLKVDIFDNKISTHGHETMLCINGRPANEDEIKTLNPQDIKRIDYYDSFNPKHPTANSVIDFIMARHDRGASVYLSAGQHVNRFSGDDLADVKIFHKKSEFNIQLSGYYNHYNPENGEESTTCMDFGGTDVAKTVEPKSFPIHENGLNGKFSYLRYGNNDIFHVATYLGGGHSARTEDYSLKFTTDVNDYQTKDRNHSDNLQPAAQIYYEKHLANKHFFKMNVYGSYNETDNQRFYTSNVDYNAKTAESYYYLNPNFVYYMPIKQRNIAFLSVDYFLHKINQTYTENLLQNKSELNYTHGILQLGDNYQIVPQKVSFTLQLSDRIMTINKQKKHYFSPQLFYKANISDNQELHGMIVYGIFDPQMKYYNNAVQSLDYYQVLVGNPDLATSRCFRGELSYTIKKLNFLTMYENTSKSLYDNVYLDGGKYVHTFLNGGKSEHFLQSAEYTIELAKHLNWTLAAEYDFYKERDWDLLSRHQVVGYTALMYMTERFYAKAEFITGGKKVEQGYIVSRPAELKINFGYNIKKWNFMLQIKNPLIKVCQEREYQNVGYSFTSKNYMPLDAYNYVKISASYRFNLGGHHDYKYIEMDNSQKSGILRGN